MASLLEVRNLVTHFFTQDGVVKAVDGISYDIGEGEVVGVVGESGCGKSVHALSIMRLVANPPGRIVSGEIVFEGEDLLQVNDAEMRPYPRKPHSHGVPGAYDLLESSAHYWQTAHRDP